MINVSELEAYLNQLLAPKLFDDFAPNGLQVEGKEDIIKIVTGVTASAELIKQAIHADADAILVHHGYFWKNEDPCIRDMKQKRLKLLLSYDVNLFAYHLPLDAHRRYGNNVMLAKQLNLSIETPSDEYNNTDLFFTGKLDKPMTGLELASHIANALEQEPQHIASEKESIETVAWCTGAAQDYIHQALERKVDAFITGEVSERTFHEAKELKIHFYAAGHHATERYGVQALGEHLAEKFGITHEYIEIENPI